MSATRINFTRGADLIAVLRFTDGPNGTGDPIDFTDAIVTLDFAFENEVLLALSSEHDAGPDEGEGQIIIEIPDGGTVPNQLMLYADNSVTDVLVDGASGSLLVQWSDGMTKAYGCYEINLCRC